MTEIKLITFLLGEEKFGLDINVIDTVSDKEEITKLPDQSEEYEGVINFRKKEVIPILNLRKKFSINSKEIKRKYIVIKHEDKKFGIVVDDVKEVRTINTNVLESTNNLKNMIKKEYVDFIARLDDEMIIILNPNKLFK
ncbi:MAG: chemotaxis protein CheW [Thermotogota bacterium]